LSFVFINEQFLYCFTMNNLQNIFKAKSNNVFGMIHVKPLPGKSRKNYIVHHYYSCNFYYTIWNTFTGTPLYNGSIKEIIYAACKEAEIYLKSAVVSSEYIIRIHKKK